MQEHANLPTPGADSPEADLEGQIDRLQWALRDWQRTREYSPGTQKRLERLTVQCARLVEAWQQAQRRRDGGDGDTGAGGALEPRHRTTGDRIRALERAIEQEWESLPSGGPDRTRQISEQAVSLVESCVSATNLALRGFADAEARVSTLEREIKAEITQISRDLQAVLAELRSLRQSGLPPAPAPFPLEGVMRIHQELQESAPPPAAQQAGLPTPVLLNSTAPEAVIEFAPALASEKAAVEPEMPAPSPEPGPRAQPVRPSVPAFPSEPSVVQEAQAAQEVTPPPVIDPGPAAPIEMRRESEARPVKTLQDVPQLAAALSARVESLERVVEDVAQRTPAPPSRWRAWTRAAGVFLAVGVVAVLGLGLQRYVDERLNESSQRVAAAERERDAAIDAARREAARQVADARQSAAQAQIVGNVLAAPDLVRYWLRSATPDSPAYGHVLVSRTRGLVFSASRLAPADAGRTYQLWLSTSAGPVSAGLANPDTEGRVTLATEVPLALTGRLSGAFVTLEPEGGRTEPSSQVVLVRVE